MHLKIRNDRTLYATFTKPPLNVTQVYRLSAGASSVQFINLLTTNTRKQEYINLSGRCELTFNIHSVSALFLHHCVRVARLRSFSMAAFIQYDWFIRYHCLAHLIILFIHRECFHSLAWPSLIFAAFIPRRCAE